MATPIEITAPVYSNGFNLTKVLAALVSRLGWRDSAILDTANATANSGRYFNDFHALVTVKNVRDNIEDKDLTDETFNTFLTKLQKSIIMRCLNSVFREPEYIEQAILFERDGRQQTQLIPNTGQVVGWTFEILEDFGMTTKVENVILAFNEDVTFHLFCYLDGQKTPIWSKSVSAVANKRTIVEIDNLFLSYGEQKHNKFFICYFQDDLGTAKAIQDSSIEFEDTNCFEAEPFIALATNDEELDQTTYSETTVPYGLNFEVSVFRDHTQQILRKANLFDEAVGLQMAVNVIELISLSTRSNKTERITKEAADKLFNELNQAFPTQDFPFFPGLKSQLSKEVKRLNDAFFKKSKSVNINLS